MRRSGSGCAVFAVGLLLLAGPPALHSAELRPSILVVEAPLLVWRVAPAGDLDAAYGGPVVLSAEVTETGQVVKIRVVKPGARGFTRACIRAFAQWRYEPARFAGRAVRAWVVVTFTPPVPRPV